MSLLSTRAALTAIGSDLRFRASFLPIAGALVRPAKDRAEAARQRRMKQAGQVIVLFALMLTALIGLVGLAIDATWASRTSLEIQRAADAGALAGSIYLPGDVAKARTSAYDEARKNGYTADAALSVTIVADPHAGNNRQLDVTITAPSPTFFVRLFGVDSFKVTRTGSATYVLPVPMGSPLNYWGVGCFVLKSGAAPGCDSLGTGASGIKDPAGEMLGSLGAFGTMTQPNGDAENGDAVGPKYNRLPSHAGWYTDPNPQHDAAGYFYTVELPAGGDIRLFDPGFCEMGRRGANYYGAGDHWVNTDNDTGSSHSPVSTYYRLWDTHGQPLIQSAWTLVTDSGSTFASQKGTDSANPSDDTKKYPAYGSGPCDAYHNNWDYSLGSVGAGTYEVEVMTTDPADPGTIPPTNAQNMFAILAVGGKDGDGHGPEVHGRDRMCVYNNLAGGKQQFYLAKVDQTAGAGKTLNIDLFDIGDSTAGTLEILSPEGGTPTAVPFSYTTSPECATNVSKGLKSDNCTGTGVTSVTVAGKSGSSFNSTWLHVTIPLKGNYGSSGLWEGGWWQIRYNVSAGNDVTTWGVSLSGNPVHLVPQ